MSLIELIVKRKKIQSELNKASDTLESFLEDNISVQEDEEQDYIIVDENGVILLTCRIENHVVEYGGPPEQDATLDIDMHTDCLVINVYDL